DRALYQWHQHRLCTVGRKTRVTKHRDGRIDKRRQMSAGHDSRGVIQRLHFCVDRKRLSAEEFRDMLSGVYRGRVTFDATERAAKFFRTAGRIADRNKR